MKTNENSLNCGNKLAWIIATIIVGLIICLAQRSKGAIVSIGSIGLGDIPATSSPSVAAKVTGGVGDSLGSFKEVVAVGQSTANINFDWNYNSFGSGSPTQIMSTLVTMVFTPTDLTISLNGPFVGDPPTSSDQTSTASTVVSLKSGGLPINTVYFYVDSIAGSQWSAAIASPTFNNGAINQPLGSISVTGNDGSAGIGYQFTGGEFDGGGTIAFDVVYTLQAGSPYAPINNDQRFIITAFNDPDVIPEPSAAILALLSTTLIFRRRR